MNSRLPLRGKVVAISVSESADMPVLGLSDLHLRDAMTEIPRHLLALGAQMVYGGDLREGGFSKLLFELVARHSSNRRKVSVTNFLAWPIHIGMSFSHLMSMVDELDGSARIVCLKSDGEEILFTARKRLERQVVPLAEWSSGLTAMRATMSRVSDARIVLGGRVDQYKGSMPGIAEEALLSMRAGQPLYVVGGFGGCARDIAEALTLVGDRGSERSNWANRKDFREYSGKDLHNGLTAEENEILARTPHIDQAVALILRGLTKVFNRPRPSGE